jgi:uncharacterized membrane protein required for colicin V production
MIDLLLMAVIAWTGMIGWMRGIFRALIDAVSVMSTVFFVTVSIPVLKDTMIDGEWRLGFDRWLQLWLRDPQTGLFPRLFPYSIPASAAMNVSAKTVMAERIYEMVIVSLSAMALIVGIQLILQVFETVWTPPQGILTHRIGGLLIGLVLGLFVAVYLVNSLGMLSWVSGMEGLDHALSQSLLVHLFVHGLPWYF